MTDTGIKILDVYILTYNGIRVIFQVCDTTEDTVTLIELATKRYKHGITLTKRYKATKNPLVIKKDNVFTRSSYEVKATRPDKKLPIKIDMTTKLFWEANKYVEYPRMGVFLAVPFTSHRTTFWRKPEKEEKECDITKLA